MRTDLFLQVFADGLKVNERVDPEGAEGGRVADAGKLEEGWRLKHQR